MPIIAHAPPLPVVAQYLLLLCALFAIATVATTTTLRTNRIVSTVKSCGSGCYSSTPLYVLYTFPWALLRLMLMLRLVSFSLHCLNKQQVIKTHWSKRSRRLFRPPEVAKHKTPSIMYIYLYIYFFCYVILRSSFHMWIHCTVGGWVVVVLLYAASLFMGECIIFNAVASWIQFRKPPPHGISSRIADRIVLLASGTTMVRTMVRIATTHIYSMCKDRSICDDDVTSTTTTAAAAAPPL